jgi:hypothetical protein
MFFPHRSIKNLPVCSTRLLLMADDRSQVLPERQDEDCDTANRSDNE